MLINNQYFKISIFFIIIYFFYFNIFSIIKYFLFSYIKTQIELNKIKFYFKFCKDYKSNKLRKQINKQLNPKISVISPMYNRERYIFEFLKNLQYQNFEDIEIILIDDCSKDNTIKIIKEYQKIDKRLILLKNKKNKGTFLSRNIAAQYSKSKYISFLDPDDIITKNILNICYKYSEKYKYEMISFDIYNGEGHINLNKYSKEFKKNLLNQPEISYNIFYLNNELEITDYNIYNKFIKKEVYIKSLNSLNNFYSNIYMILMEDQIMSYILHRKAKSFYFLKLIGYYYNSNSISITKNEFKFNKMREIFIFIYLKFIFEYSKNTKYEKDIANFLFTVFYKHYKVEKELSSTISKN